MEESLTKKATTNWEFSYTKLNQINMPDPYGSNIQINEVLI